jgi:hypothetical protein
MPLYEIEQIELYTQGYLVSGDSEADAIARFFRGDCKLTLTSIEFAGVLDSSGLSLTEWPDLASELMDLGVINSDDTFVPSIHSIREVGEEDQGSET